MSQENYQKIKLLKLIELLKQETDEQHPLTTTQIIKRLGSLHITCERRTLSKDIALLNEKRFEVMWKWVGKEKGYYIEDRTFSVPEIRILMDAVQAAGFITTRKTAELKDILPKNLARPELDKRRLGDVVDLFTNIKIVESGSSRDILGRTYEYCLSKFAEQGRRCFDWIYQKKWNIALQNGYLQTYTTKEK